MGGNQSYMGGGAGSANMTPTPSSTASVYNAMGFNSPYASLWGGANATGDPWSAWGPGSMPVGGGPVGGPAGGPAPHGPLGPNGQPLRPPHYGQQPPGPTSGVGSPGWAPPTFASNPLLGFMGGHYGFGSPFGTPSGQDMSMLRNWLGSMYNPRNILYNQGVTDAATKSQGGTPFTGYPPPVTGAPGTTPPGTSPPAGSLSSAAGIIPPPTPGTAFHYGGTPGVAQRLGQDNPANDARVLALRNQIMQQSAERIRAGGF